MSASRRRTWLALVLLLTSLFQARQGFAFCRATTCDSTLVDCKPNGAGCLTVGLPLTWASNCVSVYVQADGSAAQNIDYDAAEASVTRAFAAWNGASCSGGKPSISVEVKGPISCDASEYNRDRSNANIVVFRDTWPYVGGEDALGLTRLRFNPDTGEIYDSDIEVNSVTEPLSVGDVEPAAVDLDSLLTHEAGHLLGLAHTRDAAATMFPGYKLRSLELRSLEADDIAGLCSIYPPTRAPASKSCEPRHGFSDSCGADQAAAPAEASADLNSSACSFSSRRAPPLGLLALGALVIFGLRRKRRLFAASLTTAALAGCSLDSRNLQYTQQAGGQPGTSSPTASAAGDDQGQGGSVVQSPGGPPMIAGCLDLDEDRVADCEETLIENAAFKTDVDAWHADAEVELSWDERNAALDLPSGSALLNATGAAAANSPGLAQHSASQCLEVIGRQLVTVYANAFVDRDQPSGGRAQVEVLLFDSVGCVGAYVSSFSTPQPLDASSGEWLALKAGSVSGADTKSAMVRLAVSRPLDALSFRANFDNVLLKVTALE